MHNVYPDTSLLHMMQKLGRGLSHFTEAHQTAAIKRGGLIGNIVEEMKSQRRNPLVVEAKNE